MAVVLEILALQSLDDEAAALKAALADVDRRLQGDEELSEARRALALVEEQADALRQDQRRVEAEVEALSDRIAREEKRLYDGSIHNPKELSSLQHDVETQKASRVRFEDELIDVLDRAEAAARERQSALRLVQQREGRWQQQQQALRHESNRLHDAIARAEAKRELQKSRLNPRAVHLYEDLRRRKGGMAVARISANACTGCRVGLPDAVRRRALSASDVAQCPNCERILAIG